MIYTMQLVPHRIALKISFKIGGLLVNEWIALSSLNFKNHQEVSLSGIGNNTTEE